MSEFPGLKVFAASGVDGGLMLVRRSRSWVAVTSDLIAGVVLDEAFFNGDGPGHPVEFTVDQLRNLRDILDQALGDA